MVFVLIITARLDRLIGRYCFALLLILGLYAVIIVMAMFLGSVASTPSTAITLIVVSAILLVPLLAVINGIVSTLQHSLYVNNLYFGNSSFIGTLKISIY